MLLIFDVIGTLFSLDRVNSVVKPKSASDELTGLWLPRMLQSAMAATLCGRYIPLKKVAESSLTQVLALKGLPDTAAGSLLRTLDELDPWDDARECLGNLDADGHQIVALSNSRKEDITALLQRADLGGFFDEIFSADAVSACKPHPAPYRMALQQMNAAPEDACMVTAHSWDALGADAAGLRTVWVSGTERYWPFPGNPPGVSVSALAEVPNVIFKQFSASLF